METTTLFVKWTTKLREACGIDPPKRARHPAKRMDADRAAAKMRLEQFALADVEPPGGIGGQILARPFAEMTLFGGQNRGRHLFDHGAITANR